MGLLQVLGALDLRFKSKSQEADFKKLGEERLIYAACAATFGWHIFLAKSFVTFQDIEEVKDQIPEILSASLSGLLITSALLRVRKGWFIKVNWELVLLLYACLSFLVSPWIGRGHQDEDPEHTTQKALYFQGLSHLALVLCLCYVPIRASFSWVLVVCRVVADCVKHTIPDNDIDEFMPATIQIILCGVIACLCWGIGWRSEKQARLLHVAEHAASADAQSHQPSSKLAAVVPIETPDSPTLLGAQVKPAGAPKSEHSEDRKHPLSLGETIPNFNVTTTRGMFALHDFLNSDPAKPFTILLSYPNDFTPVCTTELGQCHSHVDRLGRAGAKMIGLSCNSIESHHEWSKDVLSNIGNMMDDALGFPIIADADRVIVNALGIADPKELNSDGVSLPARALVILYGTTVNLTMLYPASIGRDIEHLEKLIISLNHTMASNNQLAMPANWQYGDRVAVCANVGDDDANKYQQLQTKEVPSGKSYMRSVPGPEAAL